MNNERGGSPVLHPKNLEEYAVFIASPGDFLEERRELRVFFELFNRSTARHWGVHFSVVDWENYSSVGVGRPQQLITQQTLERFRPSLALVIGLMGQRFGCPTGLHESGTEEEFEWALRTHLQTGFPEIKWFFRRVQQFVSPPDPQQVLAALTQWEKVLAFKKRLEEHQPPLHYRSFDSLQEFREVALEDIRAWLSDPERPWRNRTRRLIPYEKTSEDTETSASVEVSVMDVRLFLHSETPTQTAYHNEVVSRIQSLLSANVTISLPSQLGHDETLAVASQTQRPEIKIVQVDEFWFSPTAHKAEAAYLEHHLSAAENWEWSKFLKDTSLTSANTSKVFVLPFYTNLGLLQYRKDSGVPQGVAQSWADLARACKEWERDHSELGIDGNPQLFFDFPKATSSGLCCIFLEVFLSVAPELASENSPDLPASLASDAAIEACLIFRTLCRRAYLTTSPKASPRWPIAHYGQGRPELTDGAVNIRPDAVFSRHWYSTLHETLGRLSPEEREGYEVLPLPQGVTVVGDWYLGIISSSRAVSAAGSILRKLTSREAEIERLQLGVGLPTRLSFYTEGSSDSAGKVPLSSYVSMKMAHLRKSFERSIPLSHFANYPKYAIPLSFHLQRLLEVTAEEGPELLEQIKSLMQSLRTRSLFLGAESSLVGSPDAASDPAPTEDLGPA